MKKKKKRKSTNLIELKTRSKRIEKKKKKTERLLAIWLNMRARAWILVVHVQPFERFSYCAVLLIYVRGSVLASITIYAVRCLYLNVFTRRLITIRF